MKSRRIDPEKQGRTGRPARQLGFSGRRRKADATDFYAKYERATAPAPTSRGGAVSRSSSRARASSGGKRSRRTVHSSVLYTTGVPRTREGDGSWSAKRSIRARAPPGVLKLKQARPQNQEVTICCIQLGIGVSLHDIPDIQEIKGLSPGAHMAARRAHKAPHLRRTADVVVVKGSSGMTTANQGVLWHIKRRGA